MLLFIERSLNSSVLIQLKLPHGSTSHPYAMSTARQLFLNVRQPAARYPSGTLSLIANMIAW